MGKTEGWKKGNDECGLATAAIVATTWIGMGAVAAIAAKLVSAEGGEEGRRMRTITVYRVDYVRKSRVPIGWVEERRKKSRGDNLIGMLRLARKTFALSLEDALHIAIDVKEVSKTRDWIRSRREMTVNVNFSSSHPAREPTDKEESAEVP